MTADLPGTGGVLRSTPEDFVVDEQPMYLPQGTGDHVFVRIEKRGMTTPHAAAAIARALGISERDIGIAGMKDRHAVTRQWLSLPPPISVESARELSVEGITVLDAARHPHKLRTGHVRANRFTIRVRGVAPDAVDRARAIMARLVEPPGALNWYGEQRFGRDGDNSARGRQLVLGEVGRGRDRRRDRLMISAFQSRLFNDWLQARLADGLYRRVIAGDVLHKLGGGMFTTDDPQTDERRLTAGELAITGPMFGDRMRWPPEGTAAAERELSVLVAAGLDARSFDRVGAIASGTRRDATIVVSDPAVAAADDETLEVGFTLPGGAYATAVMRELTKTLAHRVDDTPQAA